MKIAQFRGTGKYACTIVMSREDGDEARPVEGYSRVTEWVDITFAPLSREEIVTGELTVLDVERAEVVADFALRLKNIDDRKQELLAITYQGETA